MSDYTKGPWVAKGMHVQSAEIEHFSEGSGLTIRYRKHFSLGSGWASREQRLIDARLIAAAPELLEALDSLTMWCPRGWSLELDLAITAARNAIAKAEGL